jgi:Tripartite tricarboxylate transporter family receptor
MPLVRRQFLRFAGAAVAVSGMPHLANGQAYPTRPVTMIVPFAAGGSTDVAARFVAEHMSGVLGQQVVIENAPGAGGTTGSIRAMRARPDGHTILLGHIGTHAVAVGLYPNLAYSPERDFEPVGLCVEFPLLLAVRKDFPAEDLKSSKRFFVRTDSGGQPHYRNGFVLLDCGVRQEIRLAFAQQHDSSEPKSADPMIDVNGQRIVLPYQIPSREFDVRSASLSAKMFDFIGHGANIKVSEIDQGRNKETGSSITLNMDGFLDVSVKLRKGCDQSAGNAAVTSGIAKFVPTVTIRSDAAVTLGTAKFVPAVTIRSDQAEQKRIEDDQKRAQSLPVQPLPPPADGFGPPPKSVPTVTIRSDQAEQKRIEDNQKRAQSLRPPSNTFTPGPVR